MRKIKFRAWDTVENKMIENLQDRCGLSADLKCCNHIVMQYTGLKDKNGKEEVYEDDLMKDLLHIYRVVWDVTNARWLLVDVIENKNQFKGHAISLMKKVGDIHTTPELMEKAK